jgi:hypothetical protein
LPLNHRDCQRLGDIDIDQHHGLSQRRRVFWQRAWAAIFKVLPDTPIAWREVILGGFVTSILFTVGKSLIGWYLGLSNGTRMDQRKHWAHADDKELLAHKTANRTAHEIAKKMGRTATAITSRLAHPQAAEPAQ